MPRPIRCHALGQIADGAFRRGVRGNGWAGQRGLNRCNIDDFAGTTKILQDAAYRFTSPAVFHEGEFEDLAIELNGVIDLILDGFAYRAASKWGHETAAPKAHAH